MPPFELDAHRALQAAHLGVWTWNTTNGMVASDQCWTLWAVRPGESRDGFGWAAHVDPGDRDRLTRSLHRAIQENDWLEDDYRVTLPNGEVRWLVSLGRAFPNASESSVIGVTQDVSKRNEAEQARAALAAIVASCDDAIIGKTIGGTITSWNAAAERIFGYAAAEVMGRNITLLIPDDRQHEERQIITAVQSGRGVTHYESKRLRKDGQLVDVSLTVSPVYDRHGQLIGASKIARDITALKRAQETEREAGRQKDAFLGTLAHELRNPLAPIRSAVRILELKGPDHPAIRTARDIIDRQVDHLVHLVDDLLDVSRITRGKIQLRLAPIDLRDVIQEALTTSRSLLDERGHEVTVTTSAEELPVNGDWVRLVQVVSNLLNNAARYTPAGGEVRIVVRPRGDAAAVTVADTGIGLSREMLPRVFDFFFQVSQPAEHMQSGLGVGLALSRNLVEMHGGHLVAESEGAGKGSRFTMTLPLAAPVITREDGASPLSAAATKRYRFLIVDDNVDAADSQAVLLGLLGHDAWTAYDGTTALEQAKEHGPDVVLLDLGMPGMSGFEVARQLRTLPEVADAILVAQTGWGQAEVREKTAQAGFDAHLTKPVDIPALMGILEKQRRRLDRDRDV